MTAYNVTVSRRIVFRKVIEVEADTEEAAIAQAEKDIEDEDTNDTLEWDADSWESYAETYAEAADGEDEDKGVPGREHCTRCNTQLEESQIGLCENCQEVDGENDDE